MRRWRTAGVLLATMIALGTFSACGSPPASTGGSPATAGPDTSTSNDGMMIDNGGHGGRGKAEVWNPEDGLVDPYPSAWERSKGRGRRITFFYWSGVKECYGLDRVEIEETKREVTVTIYEGRRPEAEACIELAVRVRMIVTLERPLGNRKLVDGAR